MYILLRERIYIIYTIYVLSQVFSFVMREGFHIEIFNRGVGPFSGLNFYYWSLIAMAIANLVFIHALVNAKKLQSKVVHNSFLSLTIFGVLLALIQCFPDNLGLGKTRVYTIALTFSYLSSLALAFLMILYAIIKNKERMSAILYSVSGIPLLVLGAVQILANMQVFPVNTAYRGVYLILAMAFEMIVLCFWLAHRFKQFSDDREGLLKEKSRQQQIALETAPKSGTQQARQRIARRLGHRHCHHKNET
jgi:signal transduction histidine kinase